MDSEGEHKLLSIVTLLISQLFFQRFKAMTIKRTGAGAVARAASVTAVPSPAQHKPTDRASSVIVAAAAGNGLAAAAAAVHLRTASSPAVTASSAEIEFGDLLEGLITHFAELAWTEGTYRSVRMTLNALLSFVAGMAKTDSGFRSNVANAA